MQVFAGKKKWTDLLPDEYFTYFDSEALKINLQMLEDNKFLQKKPIRKKKLTKRYWIIDGPYKQGQIVKRTDKTIYSLNSLLNALKKGTEGDGILAVYLSHILAISLGKSCDIKLKIEAKNEYAHAIKGLDNNLINYISSEYLKSEVYLMRTKEVQFFASEHWVKDVIN